MYMDKVHVIDTIDIELTFSSHDFTQICGLCFRPGVPIAYIEAKARMDIVHITQIEGATTNCHHYNMPKTSVSTARSNGLVP